MKNNQREEAFKKVVKALQRRRDASIRKAATDSNVIKPINIKKVTRIAKPHQVYRSKSIFISGSIGDVIALESFFTDEERSLVNKVFYATQKKKEIELILKSLPNFSAVQDHISVWDDFSNLWCFFSKEECINKLRMSNKIAPPELIRAEDFSIFNKFNQIINGSISYNQSSLINYNLADISNFVLPENYITICPYSTDKRMIGRDFNKNDWEESINWLKKLGLQGVVLNCGQDWVPESDAVINLANKTTITEAIEILKKSSGYIGIDSSLSVLAAKLFNTEFLQIKSVNDHCYKYAKCYYSPHNNFPFLTRSIKSPENVKNFFPISKNTKSITLNVCQGVGDIFWVYQKFAPHFDQINFCITHVSSGAKKIQSRANDFLTLLPKVNKVSSRVVSSEIYDKLAGSRFSMKEIMSNYGKGQMVFDYACNLPLEEGNRFENIDPEYAIEETVAVKSEEIDVGFDIKDYVCLYVSGTTMQIDTAKRLNLWSPEIWANFVDRFCNKYKMQKNIVAIGASYDLEATQLTTLSLQKLGHRTKIIIDSKPSNVIHILKNSNTFIGYQSGLNVLADNLDIRQIMIYFPYLEKMLYTWCKKKNIEEVFYASTFDKSPNEIIDKSNFKILEINGQSH